LEEGGKTHFSNYCGCSHAKEESFLRKEQQSFATKTPNGRDFSRFTTPAFSFAEAVTASGAPARDDGKIA
jgi:hypothetical protein